MHDLAHLDIQAWTPTAKRRPEGAEMPAARLLYDLIDVWARPLSKARVFTVRWRQAHNQWRKIRCISPLMA
jgi:hypothetical protein